MLQGSYFQQCSQRIAALEKQIDVLAMEADEVWVLVGDLESEMRDVEECGVLWILRLNQNICSKTACYVQPPALLCLSARGCPNIQQAEQAGRNRSRMTGHLEVWP